MTPNITAIFRMRMHRFLYLNREESASMKTLTKNETVIGISGAKNKPNRPINHTENFALVTIEKIIVAGPSIIKAISKLKI